MPNAIAAGNSSFHSDRKKARGSGNTGERLKMRAKDRPLENDFVSDEVFHELLYVVVRQHGAGAFARPLLLYLGRLLEPRQLSGCVESVSSRIFPKAIIWHKQHPVITRKDFMGDHEWCQPAETMVMTPAGSSHIRVATF